MDGKKTKAYAVRVSDASETFVEARYKQEGMESPSEYIRSLIDADRKKTADSFTLMAEALGVQVNNVSTGD